MWFTARELPTRTPFLITSVHFRFSLISHTCRPPAVAAPVFEHYTHTHTLLHVRSRLLERHPRAAGQRLTL